MFTDTHSHIHFLNEFPDTDAILMRAKAAGVSRQIIVGCTPKDSFQALQFVKKYSPFQLFSTLGVHPHNANELTDALLKRYYDLIKEEKKIVALGEMGLDYFRNFQPPEIQKQAFFLQLRLAKEVDLPVIVHVREAWDDALKILGESGNTKVILHCFTGDQHQADICWGRGYHTSFSGVLTYPKNQYLRDIAALAPEDKILLETDCPYLTPQKFRGQRNEPSYVVETGQELARARGQSVDDIALVTTQNAVKLFNLPSLQG